MSSSVRIFRTSYVLTISRILSTVVSSRELGFHGDMGKLSRVDNVNSSFAWDTPYSHALRGGVEGKEQP